MTAVHIRTYGCQMNERDSEAAAALLGEHNYAIVPKEEDADVIVVNTCSVREKAENKAIGKLLELVNAKRDSRPELVVGAIGCMVQRLGPELLRRVPGIDFGLGTHRLTGLPRVVRAVRAGKGPILDIGSEHQTDEMPAGHREGKHSAFVNILLGCNRRCSYCIVPQVRGPELSRPPREIMDEIAPIALSGVREVTLLGQSVMSYGRVRDVWTGEQPSTLGLTEPFPRLLEFLAGVPGLARIRFTSGHPSGCTPELARAMAGLSPVCEHLHLPMQSGSDRILGLMRRGYSADDYRRAVACIRSALPELAITTDIIVGFPSETARDFDDTRALMEEIGFDNAFIFKYSPRPGTPAAEMRDNVDPAEKLRRNHALLADQDSRGRRLNAEYVGRVVEVLVDGVSKRNATRWSGRTRTNKIVVFDNSGGNASEGDLVPITILSAQAQTLYGAAL